MESRDSNGTYGRLTGIVALIIGDGMDEFAYVTQMRIMVESQTLILRLTCTCP